MQANHIIYIKTHSSSGDDGYGNPVESWSDPVAKAVFAVHPGTPGEDYEIGRIASRVPLAVLGSTEALGNIGPRDRVVWLGREFEVDGEPESFDFGPFGWAPGMRVRIIRVEG